MHTAAVAFGVMTVPVELGRAWRGYNDRQEK